MGHDIPNMLNPDAQQALRDLGHGAAVDRLINGGLTNIQDNPQTGQSIGWDGRQWVDIKTRKPVQWK